MSPASPVTPLIFVTGGVVSSLGKGIAAASLAAILEAPISFFFEEGPSPALMAEGWVSDTPTELMTSKDCVALVRAFIAIDDKKIQQKVLSLVRSLSADKGAPADLQDQASQTH